MGDDVAAPGDLQRAELERAEDEADAFEKALAVLRSHLPVHDARALMLRGEELAEVTLEANDGDLPRLPELLLRRLWREMSAAKREAREANALAAAVRDQAWALEAQRREALVTKRSSERARKGRHVR